MENGQNEKRRIYFTAKDDLKRTEFIGRGFGKSHARKSYTEHGIGLVREFHSAVEVATQSRDSQVSSDILMEIETPKSLKIKAIRHQLSEIEIKVIKLDEKRDNFALASVKKDQLPYIGKKLQDYSSLSGNPYRGSLSIIESIKPYTERPEKSTIPSNNEKVKCIIVLYSHLSYSEKVNISNLIVSRLKSIECDGEIISFYGTYLVGISSRMNESDVKIITTEFMFVESINQDHEVEINTLKTSHSLSSSPPTVISPTGISGDFRIGIVDDGIAKNSLLKPIIRTSTGQLPVGSINIPRSHGTFVASRAVFGDDFEYLISTGEAVAHLHDIPVFGIDASGNLVRPNETDIIRAIGKAVSADADLKIINLSLGYGSVSEGKISRLASFIDQTAKQKDIIFTISSGNSDKPLTKSLLPENDPNHRIMMPSESVMATTVGSYAKRHNINCAAVKDSVSSFSRIGPGFDAGLKPEIVLSGGNSKIITDVFGGEFNDAEIGTGVYGLDTAGNVCEKIGTSFSAPVAANHFARLMLEYPGATTNFYRSIYLHSCINGLPKPNATTLARHFHGLGIPNIDSIIYNARKSLMKITQDSLESSSYLEIPFHVPSVFANAKSRLGIKVTIVFDPDTDETNPLEYVQSRISAAIMKPGSIGRRKVDLDGAGENYYKQWSPIVSWSSIFSRSFGVGEWNLRLRLHTRFGVDRDYRQDFCAIIEVFDPANTIDVEAESQKDFPLKYAVKVGAVS